MKRLNAFLLVTIGIFLIGCGIKNRPVPQPVDLTQLLSRAWTSFDSLNFDAAIPRFDSVLSLDATMSQAYFGKGMALGFKNKFPQAHNFLNLTIFAEGQSAILFAPSDTFVYDTTNVDTIENWYPISIPSEKQPILYPDKVSYKIFHSFLLLVRDTIVDSLYEKLDTGTTKDDGVIRHFSNTTIYINPLVLPTPEDVKLDTTEVLDSVLSVDIQASLFSRYYYLNMGISYGTEYPVLAYGANGAVYLAEGDYSSAIRSARASVLLLDTYAFDHYPFFTRENIQLIEAYASFRNGFVRRCVEILTEIDPDWTPPTDPENVESYPYILEELENLIRSVGTIF